MRFAWTWMCLFLLVVPMEPASGDIYRYQDANGNWCFTDTPPENKSEDQVEVIGEVDAQTEPRDLRADLYRKYAPENGVEAATLATVTVTSVIGKGSGFFIRNDGYLITNRHVLTGDAGERAEAEKAFASLDENIADAEQHYRKEAKAIAEAEANLARLKARVDDIKDPERRNSAQTVYDIELARFSVWQTDFEKRGALYEKGKERYETEKQQYHSRKLSVSISRNCTVTLKDGTELNARRVRESIRHDLALLKVDGCVTPYLTPAPDAIRQGHTVYAVGNPISLHDSVSRGIFSGSEDGFLKTDAKIYPGNSGGPLVNEDGYVLGINTFKMLTRNFEGLGFAIPIQTAMEEFHDILD